MSVVNNVVRATGEVLAEMEGICLALDARVRFIKEWIKILIHGKGQHIIYYTLSTMFSWQKMSVTYPIKSTTAGNFLHSASGQHTYKQHRDSSNLTEWSFIMVSYITHVIICFSVPPKPQTSLWDRDHLNIALYFCKMAFTVLFLTQSWATGS